MSSQPHLLRVYENIQILLHEGQFPGRAAPAIAEAQKLIFEVVEQIRKDVNEQQQQVPQGE